jgi:hypothetical protein
MALLEFDLSYRQVASGQNFPPYIWSLCIIHPRKNNNPEYQQRRLGIARIKAGSSRIRATALCCHCFILHFFLVSSGNYDHRRQTDVKIMDPSQAHRTGSVKTVHCAAGRIILRVCRSEKKERRDRKKWKGKARRPFCQSCFTGKALPHLLSTATSCCRTRGNLSSRSANRARSQVAVSISIIYKVTIRNWVPCHASRPSMHRPMFDTWAVDAEFVVDTLAVRQAFLQVLRISRHHHSTNVP